MRLQLYHIPFPPSRIHRWISLNAVFEQFSKKKVLNVEPNGTCGYVCYVLLLIATNPDANDEDLQNFKKWMPKRDDSTFPMSCQRVLHYLTMLREEFKECHNVMMFDKDEALASLGKLERVLTKSGTTDISDVSFPE